MNLGVDLRTIECQQPGCETQWVHSMVEKKYDLHIIYYHLDCVALERAP